MTLWERFDQKDSMEQLWYYSSFLALYEDAAYREYEHLFSELSAFAKN